MKVSSVDPAFIYFARAEHGLVKIGATANPLKRMATIRGKEKCEITLLSHVAVPLNSYFERMAHWMAAPWHVRGEWFRLNRTEVISLSALLLEAVDKLKGVSIDSWPELPVRPWLSEIYRAAHQRPRNKRKTA